MGKTKLRENRRDYHQPVKKLKESRRVGIQRIAIIVAIMVGATAFIFYNMQ